MDRGTDRLSDGQTDELTVVANGPSPAGVTPAAVRTHTLPSLAFGITHRWKMQHRLLVIIVVTVVESYRHHYFIGILLPVAIATVGSICDSLIWVVLVVKDEDSYNDEG